MKKRYNVYLTEENVEDLRYIYPGFNLSEFFDDCVREFILDGQEVINPVREKAKQIAIKRMKERAAQQKLIKESQSNEEIAREMMKRDENIFEDNARKLFNEAPSSYFRLLPDAGYKDSSKYWDHKADILTELCGFPVSSDRVMAFVREAL